MHDSPRLGQRQRPRHARPETCSAPPAFLERSLEAPELPPVREALDLILAGLEPYPALVIDRQWNIVAANGAMVALAGWLDPELLEPPHNMRRVLRAVVPRIANLGEVRAYSSSGCGRRPPASPARPLARPVRAPRPEPSRRSGRWSPERAHAKRIARRSPCHTEQTRESWPAPHGRARNRANALRLSQLASHVREFASVLSR